MRRAITGLLAAGALVVALATGCSSPTTDTPGEEDAEAFAFRDGLVCPDQDADAGEPTEGGTLTLAMLTEPQAIDPAVNRAPAATGGTELLAVFEPLLRYDPQAGEYVPQLAEAVEPNDDFSEWTITLRPDVTFSDGSPVDAESVVWSMERYAATPTAPDAPLWNSSVSEVTATGEDTVTITLTQPWSSFEVMLSIGPGLIVAPSSTETLIGAGPFVVEELTPRESTVMTANENYWDGAPPLERVRFLYLGAAQTSVETMQAGGADGAMLRDAGMVTDLFSDQEGYCGNMAMVAGGSILQVNAEDGRPGADPRVRRAMQLAIDPEAVNQRAFDGDAIATSQLFPEYSKWHTETEGLGYDPEEAKRLIEEAKADGFDGVVGYTGSASGQDTALAIQGQWEAVGLTVEVDLIRTIPEMIEKIMTKDYDSVYWAIGVMESDVYGRLSASLHSGGNQVFGMSTTPERDAIIDAFRSAPDDASRIELLNDLQTELNEDVPFVALGPVSDVIAWTENVHGVVPGGQGVVLLGNAWLGE